MSDGHEIQSSIATVSACHPPLSLTKTSEGISIVIAAAGISITLAPAMKSINDNEVSERPTARLGWEHRHIDRTGPDKVSSVKSSLQCLEPS